MKSYILRIYREEKNNPRNFVGILEEVAAGEKKAFTCLDELWAILNPAVKNRGNTGNAENNARSVVRSNRRR